MPSNGFLQRTPERRVKVYELSSDGNWQEQGVGHVALFYFEKQESNHIVVKSEDTDAMVLNCRVRKEDNYQRQQGTLIVWTDANGTDLALSFQEAAGCDWMWDQLMEVQNRLRAAAGDIDNLPAVANEEEEAAVPMKSISLPEPSSASLPDIEAVVGPIRRSGSMFARDQLAAFVLRERYLDKLLQLFEDLEDLEDRDSLEILGGVVRGILYTNDSTVYEYVTRDEVIQRVVGALEYDRELPGIQLDHRRHLESNNKYKLVVAFRDKDVERKIHQTFRIQFLKDVVLARTIDDANHATLTHMAFMNHVEIVDHIAKSDDFLDELFGILKADDAPLERRKQVILFLNELCGIAKTLQVMSRNVFYKSLAQHGLFGLFENTLDHSDGQIRNAIAAILASILDHDSSMVRSYSMAQVRHGTGRPLVDLLISRMHEEPDAGIRGQAMEIIRVMLDTNQVEGAEGLISHAKHDPDSESFLEDFYDRRAAKLVEPITSLEPSMLVADRFGGRVLPMDERIASTCNLLLELLCFAVKNHGFTSKKFILGSTVTEKSLLLLKAKEKYIRLAALRYIRTQVGMKDDFYNRHLVKNHAFGPVVELFVSVKDRNNLINSACLELFELIGKENIKPLIDNIVPQYRQTLEEASSLETVKRLGLRYDQNHEVNGVAPADEEDGARPAARARKGADRSGWSTGFMDEDEEAYFENEEDEENVDGENQPDAAPALLLPRPRPTDAFGDGDTDHLLNGKGRPPLTARKSIEFVRAPLSIGPLGNSLATTVASPGPLVDYPLEDEEEEPPSPRKRAFGQDDIANGVKPLGYPSGVLTTPPRERKPPPLSGRVTPSKRTSSDREFELEAELGESAATLTAEEEAALMDIEFRGKRSKAS
ncbi:component of IIS longevity pathway SMK-1-domain-containing protein [Hyaloraphidium curvatum]|nr:component of IIS longevity pathway SMK-1-domain-containing protein [Hyaloraphidium curvatum]